MLISLLTGAGVAYCAVRLGRRLGAGRVPRATTVTAPVRGSGAVDPAPPTPGRRPPAALEGPEERDRALRKRVAVASGTAGLMIGGHVFTPLVVPGGLLLTYAFGQLLWHSWSRARQAGRYGITVLDTVAISGMLVGGYWTVASTAVLVSTGADWLARRTERRSMADLSDAFGARGGTVRLAGPDGVVECPRGAVEVGDAVVVDAGEVVLVDGVVIEGSGALDQSSLTGESMPVGCGPGDPVLASSLLIEGRLIIRASRSGRETVADGLMDLLREVERTRAYGATRAEAEVERWLPPTAVAAGAGLLLLGPAAAVAATCAGIGYGLRYASPTAVLRHLRVALQGGILVRDGRALEALAEVDVVIFDKTGTLTRSKPMVRRVIGVDGFDPREVLRLAASAEQHQSHPIGAAIRDAAAAADLEPPPAEATRLRVGFGLSSVVEGREVVIGSERLMDAAGVTMDHPALLEVRESEAIVVHVAVAGRLAGAIELEPAVRDEVTGVVEALHARGVRVYALSGDREAPTARLAADLGLDGYFAEVLPDEKARVVRRFQAEGSKVCFVGDGINDTLALSTADASVSLKGAATIAEDLASILMLDGELTRLPDLFALADSMDGNISRSEAVSRGVGLVTLVGVFAVHLGVGSAVALYQAGIAGAVGNALVSPIDAIDGGGARAPTTAAAHGPIDFVATPLIDSRPDHA